MSKWTTIAMALWCALSLPVYAQNTTDKAQHVSPTGPLNQPPRELTPADSGPQRTMPASFGPINAYVGLTVRDIRFEGVVNDPRAVQHLQTLIVQQVREPLDRNKIRKSVQALFSTGRFADIQVEAEKTPQNEVSLVFRGTENIFVGSVTVEGAPGRPTANQLQNATKLQLGELFTPEKLEQSLKNMNSVMMDNGFYQSKIRAQQDYQPEAQQIGVNFKVVPGKPARVGQLAVTGNAGYSLERIRAITKLKTGQRATAEAVTRALQRLRNKYQKADRLEAQVSVTDRTYHPENNTLDYVFKIRRGPIVDIRVEGAKISEGKLKRFVPVYEEGAVDDDLLNEGRRNLRDYFQGEGYFNVDIRVDRNFVRAEERLHILYVVNLGDKHKLDAINILGNNYFSDSLIREQMVVRPASGLLAQGRFSQSLLNRDIESITNLYKANGFQQVQVTSDIQDNYRGDKGNLLLSIKVNEGRQTKVASVKIGGNKVVPDDELQGLLTSLEGQPYSEVNLATDRESVLNYYFNHGFPNATFDSSISPEPGDATRMNVVYTIKEGQQVFVDRILLSGLDFTRQRVVRREFQIRASDPMSQVGIIETQRRLYDLGLFNEVDIAVQNPEGRASFKDLLLDFKEAKRWIFNYGFGLEIQTGTVPANATQLNTSPAPGVDVPPGTTPPGNILSEGQNAEGGTLVSPRVSFEVTRLNFRGRDHTITFKSHLGNLQKRAIVSYEAPRWMDKKNWVLTLSSFYDNSRDVRTFTSERIEGSVQLQQAYSRITTLAYRFTFRRVAVNPKSLVISPELVPLFSKPTRVGGPSFTYIRDKRDDPLDTHKGNYTTFDTGAAAAVFGSVANFGRFMVQNSSYHPFKGMVFAHLIRVGVEEPFGKSSNADSIPLPERFYAGGASSLRGFALNQAGPRDLFTGFPIGGNAVFLNSLELRLPPAPLPWVGNNLSFVLFHDAGNVFETGQDMVKSFLRFNQKNRRSCGIESERLLCDFNFISHAFGTGIRYRTPIGPVRLDFSYNVNPTRFPFYVQCPSTAPDPKSKSPCLALPPNSLIFQSGTLRHFNFFFSIGQSF